MRIPPNTKAVETPIPGGNSAGVPGGCGHNIFKTIAVQVFSGVGRTDEIGSLSRALTSLVKRLEQALDREKSFTRHASHEMRTPLSVIVNSTSVLALPDIDPDKREASMRRIRQSCDDLQALLDVFLALGQEDFYLPTETLELEPLLAQLLERYVHTIASKGMTVHSDVELLPRLKAPPALFTIVLDNMLRNAIYHGAESLRVTAKPGLLEVANQLTPNATPGETGYGLEICKRICARQAWRFQARREGDVYRATLVLNE